MDSVLLTIKQMLGIDAAELSFDSDIIVHINSAFMSLNMLGLGPEEGFSISDDTGKWSDFTDRIDLNGIKSYIYLKVKTIFDPPTSSYVLESYSKVITELEWRLNVKVEEGTL